MTPFDYRPEIGRDGWYPLVDDVDQFAKDVIELRHAAEDAGRDPDELILYPVMVTKGCDIPPEKLEKLRAIGVRHLMLTDDDHGHRMTTGQAKAAVDDVAHLVERWHALG